jgi:putative hydrolase
VLGFETKLLDFDGNLDISSEIMKKAELLVCSLHRIPGLHKMEGELTLTELPKDAKDYYIRAMKAICNNKNVDIIGHPFDLLRKFRAEFPNEDEMHDIARYIAQYGKGVEINTKYKVPTMNFIGICKQYSVKFSIGSDAEDYSRVGDVFWSIDLLREAGGNRDDLMSVCRYE